MSRAIRILCAVQDRKRLYPLILEMDDGENFLFDVVTSGNLAIMDFRKATPDILVIDAVLAGLDGLGVMDWLKGELGAQAPRVIGIAGTPFSRDGFLRRGAKVVISAPCDPMQLKAAILQVSEEMKSQIDWDALRPIRERAGLLLAQMGMNELLKGFGYLSWAAALACENEGRLFSVSKEIYAPIAGRCETTKENVERLIRHAIESTMSAASAKGVYTLFGNTIDPAKGKPTNAHVIALLAQRLRVEKAEAIS